MVGYVQEGRGNICTRPTSYSSLQNVMLPLLKEIGYIISADFGVQLGSTEGSKIEIIILLQNVMLSKDIDENRQKMEFQGRFVVIQFWS